MREVHRYYKSRASVMEKRGWSFVISPQSLAQVAIDKDLDWCRENGAGLFFHSRLQDGPGSRRDLCAFFFEKPESKEMFLGAWPEIAEIHERKIAWSVHCGVPVHLLEPQEPDQEQWAALEAFEVGLAALPGIELGSKSARRARL